MNNNTETSLQIGQECVIDGGLSNCWMRHRVFCTVKRVGKRITLQDSLGNLYRRNAHNIATFTHLPANWDELFDNVEQFYELTPFWNKMFLTPKGQEI